MQRFGLSLNYSTAISGLLISEITACDTNKTDYLFILIRCSCCILLEEQKEKNAYFNMEGIWTLTYIYSLCVLLLVAVQSKTHVEMVVQLDLFILQLFAPKNVPWITCCLLQLRPSNTSSPITSSPFSTF